MKHLNTFDTSKLVNKTDHNAKIKDIENKIPSTTNLASFVQNKILNASDQVKKWNYFEKIKDIKSRYFTTSDYNNFTINVLDVKVNILKLDIKRLVPETELTAEKDKIQKLNAYDSSFFIVQSIQIFQPNYKTFKIAVVLQIQS